VSDTEIVHPVPPGEIAPWLASMVTTFLGDPADAIADAPARAASWNAERAWGARSDGRWVATLRTEPRAITVPGAPLGAADLVADALTNVTVAATHRRLGLLRSMLTESLLAARENGEAVSALIAAEWPIYGRYLRSVRLRRGIGLSALHRPYPRARRPDRDRADRLPAAGRRAGPGRSGPDDLRRCSNPARRSDRSPVLLVGPLAEPQRFPRRQGTRRPCRPRGPGWS
jgi:hypothetical protein